MKLVYFAVRRPHLTHDTLIEGGGPAPVASLPDVPPPPGAADPSADPATPQEAPVP